MRTPVRTILFVKFLGAVMLAMSAACSSTLQSTILLEPITPPQHPEEPVEPKPLDSQVYVDEFNDARAEKGVVRMQDEGRFISSANDVVEVVVQGIEKALRKKGYQFSDTAPVILSGEVREWLATVTGTFSKKIEGNAELYVEVRDFSDRRVYSGIYKGYAARETTGLSEKDVQDILKSSMTEAISQVTGDEQMMKLLSSF